jgi:Ribbon-helix-helix protein, copG family
MAESSEIVSGKARKRSSARAATRPVAEKVKATIHLSVEASQRLTVHAAMMGMDRSELVEKLIHDHLRRYVVSDRGGVGDAADSEVAA